MVNIGAGASCPTHIKNFLAALNIPSLHHKSLKTLENRMEKKKMVALEEQSCREALEKEKVENRAGKFCM